MPSSRRTTLFSCIIIPAAATTEKTTADRNQNDMEPNDITETNGSHETLRLAASSDSHHQVDTDKNVVEMTTSQKNYNASADLDDGRQDEDGRHVDFAAHADPASAGAGVASRANDPEMNGSHASVQGRPATSTGYHHQAATDDDDVVERKTSTFDANSGIDDRRDEDGRRVVDDDAVAIAVDEGDVPRGDAQDCDVSDISDSSPSSLVSVKRC